MGPLIRSPSLRRPCLQEHVAAQLVAYAPVVSVGSYLIVEDTNVNGDPVCQKGEGFQCDGTGSRGGPRAAVDAWLPSAPNFVREMHWGARYHHSQHRSVFLKKIAAARGRAASSVRGSARVSHHHDQHSSMRHSKQASAGTRGDAELTKSQSETGS